MRDQVDRKASPGRIVDGKAHPVDSDRAFGRDEASERRRRIDLEPCASAGVADRLDPDDDAHAVDMPADEVAAEPIGEPQRLLQVDAPRPVEAGRVRQRFGRNVERQ